VIVVVHAVVGLRWTIRFQEGADLPFSIHEVIWHPSKHELSEGIQVRLAYRRWMPFIAMPILRREDDANTGLNRTG
jgi:hypothetical protein